MADITIKKATTSSLTLLLNHEIASVITAMRYNSKWAVVPKYYEEERNEANRYDEAFRNLRSEIFKFKDWKEVEPMVYLTPFLSLIKASDVSGPITGAAAVALQRVLNSDLLSLSTKNVQAAINQIVEDATQCKFESTSNTSDEVVLLNIVQVLGQAVACPAGLLLSDDTICKAFQATFMLGDPVTRPKEYGDMMGYYSRQTCGDMIRIVFGRLAQLAEYEQARAEGREKALPSSRILLCQHGVKAAAEILDFLIELLRKDPSLGREQLQIEETIVFSLEMIHAALLALGRHIMHYDILLSQIHVDLLHAMSQAVINFTSVSIINGFCQIMLSIYSFMGSVSMGQIETVLERVLLRQAEGKGVVVPEQQEAALEGVLDLCRQPGFVHDVFANCDCRIERSNLFENICSLISKTAFPVSKGSLGPLHLISLEALLAILGAIAAENKPNNLLPPPPDLELPTFVDLWGPLVSGEHPDISPLLEADQLRVAAGVAVAPLDPAIMTGSLGIESAAEVAAAEAAAASQGTSLPSSSAMALQPSGSARVAGSGSEASTGPSSDFMRLRCAVYEKHLKLKVALAVDHFNKDYKKGVAFLQASGLLPKLKKAGDSDGSSGEGFDEATVSTCLGRFLKACPGLNKVAIGELLGEPDQFYLQVLDAYTKSFDFRDLKFDAAIRLFLEAFRLPGEAQKIDRIINSFGKHYYSQNQGVFRSSDAAYVLSYSVIMLNTDRHSSQVKNKMTLESFRRNLRDVNEGENFPEDFLNDIFYSIVKTPLRMSEASSMDVSEQQFVQLSQASRTPRGVMIHADPGRHLFDTTMFRLVWGPAVHALCSIVDNVGGEVLVEQALNGLQVAAHIAACHQLEDVADSVVVSLSKVPMALQHQHGTRPEVLFGRDAKMKAVTRAIAAIANKHGDCLQSGWSNIMELIIAFYRQGCLPDSFCKALNGDGEGGLVVKEGECSSLKARRAAAKTQASQGSSLFKSISSFTSFMALPGTIEPEYPGSERQLSDSERQLVAAGEEVLARAAFEDIFMDSKFLKQESLVHLVKAIIMAGGPIPPRQGGGGSGAASGRDINSDVTELCLELLFTVLLRNRDRIGLLWPRIYEYFQNIFSHSKECELTLVQKAIMAMMRLCQRLLPYKRDISEPLMKGIQLVSLVDEQVASDMAATIAAEVLNLLKGAAPYIQQQPVWVSICGLIKIIQYDPASFPACVETLTWVVKEALTPLNFTIMLQTVVDLLERSVPDARKGERQGHPQHIPDLLLLLVSSSAWLERWWEGVLATTPPDQLEPSWGAFKHEAWYQVMSSLCRVIRNPNLEVRTHAVGYLQRCVVSGEKLVIAPPALQQSLTSLVLPMTHDLCKVISNGSKEFPQADRTVSDLVKAVVKVVLLYADQLQRQPAFGTVWRAILESLAAVMQAGSSARSEVVAETVPESLKNMLLVLLNKGTLKEGWRDGDGTDLWEATWRTARKVSPNLTPQTLLGS